VPSQPRRTVAADPSTPDAITRALADLGGPGIVYLPPGTFAVRSVIKLPSHVAVIGAGADHTTIELAPGAGCHVFTNEDGGGRSEGIELRGFRLEGNMRTQHKPPDLKGITFACGGYFKRVDDLVVADVVASSIRQTAFHFNNCSKVRLERLTTDELGWSGVSTSGTDDITLREVVVTRAGLDKRHSGIHLDGGHGASVHALVEDCTGNGIMLDSTFAAMSDVVVRGVARRCMRGLSLSGDRESQLLNVHISGDYSNNRECGVLVSNASWVFIVDATIASNGDAGVIVQGAAGSEHCVVSSSRITDSPDLLRELHGSTFAYVTDTALIPQRAGAEPLPGSEPTEPAPPPETVPAPVVATADPPAAPTASPEAASPPARPLVRRVGGKVARSLAGVKAKAPAPTEPIVVPEDHAYTGICNVCGAQETFVRGHRWMREGYRCRTCTASLRYRGQADAILRAYAHGATTLADLVREPDFASLDIWEPGVLGPFRAHLSTLAGYTTSDYWPDVEPGQLRDGVRCEDLMALTYAPASFDLVITSDIFEHIRKPYVAFAEVHRVLRPGGRHIFSVPIPDDWLQETIERVDTSGPEDVLLLEPKHHLGPGGSQHLVYNNFGRDLVDHLGAIGLDTEVVLLDSPHPDEAALRTFCSTKV
jgi:hypothetical protein